MGLQQGPGRSWTLWWKRKILIILKFPNTKLCICNQFISIKIKMFILLFLHSRGNIILSMVFISILVFIVMVIPVVDQTSW